MTFSVRLLDDLGSIDTETWQALADRDAIDTSVFLTPPWQRSWWDTFGRGDLLPILVSRSTAPVLLAVLFVDEGMAFFVGAGGSDYLDFIGESGDVEAVTLALEAAMDAVPDLLGFRFHHVPDWSPTAGVLAQTAARLGLEMVDEGHHVAPYLDVASEPEAARAAPERKSLVRHDRWFRREGDLRIEHLDDPTDVLPHLDAFFDQHVERWRTVGVQSQFLDTAQREFFRSVAAAGGAAGWLRFTRVLWDDRVIAAHFGFSHNGSFLWYKPTYDVELARRSPGEVLMRSLLLEALDDGVQMFDFGLGEESFKQRFATGVRTVRNWGLYPSASRIRVSA